MQLEEAVPLIKKVNSPSSVRPWKFTCVSALTPNMPMKEAKDLVDGAPSP